MYYQKMHLSLWSNEGKGFKLNRDQWSPSPSGLMTPDLSFFGVMGGIRVRREVDEVLHPSFLMPAAHACRSSVMIFGWSGSVQQDVLKNELLTN